MEKQAYTLVKSLKAFRVYVLHSKIIVYVHSTSVKENLIQSDIDGRRRKWIAKILEFYLEIKPIKIVKGQGLAKMLAESNCKYLGVSFINVFSKDQWAEFSDKISQDGPPLAECAWYKYIRFFLQELRTSDGMGRRKARYLKQKVVRYCLIDQALYWKDTLGVLLRFLDPYEAQRIMFDFHINLCGRHHF